MTLPHAGSALSLSLAAGTAAFLAALPCGALAQAAAPVPAAPLPRFDILEYVIEGNSVLPAEALERAVYPYLGEQRKLDDVQAARAALEQAYRAAGYATVGVDIPEQRVAGGVVTLRVVQGEVARLRVTGSRYFSQGRILEQVPALAEGQVPRLPQVQEQLAAVNRTADRRVSPLLRPGKAPGTTEVDLQVEDQLPLHGSLELNNRASPNTSATRLLASLRYDNLWQRDHSLAVQVQTSPEKTREVKVASGTYTVPLGLDQLVLSLVRSDSEVAAGVGDTTVFGKGTIWGLKRSLVIALREHEYHSLTFGAEYKRFDETTEVGSGSGFATPIRYLPLSASYQGVVDDAAGRWQIGTGLVVGVRGLASDEAQFADKRYGASGGYSVLKFDLAREQKLPLGLTLAARLDGQAGGQPLISNEQFVAGGVDSVRGYLESAAVGDSGVRGSLELRTSELVTQGGPWPASLAAHAYLEGAALELRQPLPGQQWRFRLLAAGFGLRAQARPHASLNLDFGWPLMALGSTQRADLRVHASGALEF
jgi:hemolysin activation/secretion protein